MGLVVALDVSMGKSFKVIYGWSNMPFRKRNTSQ
ncbi:hypothetical protein JOE23_002876 [Amphibacillus cookii]|nr:hypothetical protein [Amphibacillus cookii]